MAANSAVSAEPFADLPVTELKALIKDINARRTGGNISTAGNKPHLIERAEGFFKTCKEIGDLVNYETGRRDLERYYGSPVVGATRPSRYAGQSHGYQAGNHVLGGVPSNKFSSSSSVSGGGYNGAAPRFGLNGAYGNHAGTSSGASYPHTPRVSSTITNFKRSPFVQPKEWVCGPVTAYEAPAQNERKQASLFIYLKPEQVALLEQKDHQLRLFSAPKPAWDLGQNPNHPVTVEFPVVCELRVNKTPLSVNLRGGKKGPAKVLPPNLNKDKALALTTGRMNHVEMLYANAPKAYILAAAICSVVDSPSLVTTLKASHLKPKDVVLGNMKRAADDDDVEVGEASLSLKCPLSYMRLQTPCRSEACTHVQCFDALSFYSINEQTPSWQCPVCFKSVDPASLFWDGYVQDILDRVPEEVETVLTDAVGNWRTSNDAISSERASATTSQLGANRGTDNREASGTATPLQTDYRPNSSSEDVSKKRKHSEVFEIIDDDEDDGDDDVPLKSRARPNGNGFQPQTNGSPSVPPEGEQSSAQIIDLTFSDSEDDDIPTPPLPPSAGLSSTVTSVAPTTRQYPSTFSSSHLGTNGGGTGHADRLTAPSSSSYSMIPRVPFQPLDLPRPTTTSSTQAPAPAPSSAPPQVPDALGRQNAASNEASSVTDLHRPRTPPREGGDSDEEDGQINTPSRANRQAPPWSRWDEEDGSFDDGDDRLYFDARAGLGGGQAPVGQIGASGMEQ